MKTMQVTNAAFVCVWTLFVFMLLSKGSPYLDGFGKTIIALPFVWLIANAIANYVFGNSRSSYFAAAWWGLTWTFGWLVCFAFSVMHTNGLNPDSIQGGLQWLVPVFFGAMFFNALGTIILPVAPKLREY